MSPLSARRAFCHYVTAIYGCIRIASGSRLSNSHDLEVDFYADVKRRKYYTILIQPSSLSDFMSFYTLVAQPRCTVNGRAVVVFSERASFLSTRACTSSQGSKIYCTSLFQSYLGVISDWDLYQTLSSLG